MKQFDIHSPFRASAEDSTKPFGRLVYYIILISCPFFLFIHELEVVVVRGGEHGSVCVNEPQGGSLVCTCSCISNY